jgi:hypothetical protein
MKTISTLTLLLALAMPACASQVAARGPEVIDPSASLALSTTPETHKHELAADGPRAVSRIALERMVDRTERSNTRQDAAGRAR